MLAGVLAASGRRGLLSSKSAHAGSARQVLLVVPPKVVVAAAVPLQAVDAPAAGRATVAGARNRVQVD